MIDFSTLPKEPIEALSKLLSDLEEVLLSTNNHKSTISAGGTKYINSLRILLRATMEVSKRIEDKGLIELCNDNLELTLGQSVLFHRDRLKEISSYILVVKMNEHFISSEDTEQFDKASLTQQDRDEIRGHLQTARKLTTDADFLSEDHKRRILHRIARVENELFKEKAGFGALIAAGYEGSKLLKQYGEDAQGIATAFEKSRTITEKRVGGYNQVEGPDETKRLPAPDPK